MVEQVEPVNPVMDQDAALQRFGGNAAALKRSALEFLEGCPERLEEMRQAISAGDARGLQHAAYRMDWELSRLSAGAAFEAALSLERMGKEGDLEDAPKALEMLAREIDLLAAQLRVLDA